MSYEILYRSVGIEIAPKQYIVLCQQGSSNCTNITYDRTGRSREVRARDWSTFIYGNHCPFGEIKVFEDILNSLKNEYIGNRSSYDNQVCTEKNFGWFSAISYKNLSCSKTTWGMINGFYMNAIKNAKPLSEININLKLHFWESSFNRENVEIPSDIYLEPETIVEQLTYWTNELNTNPLYKKVHMYICPVSNGSMDRYLEIEKMNRHNKRVKRLENLKVLTEIVVNKAFVIQRLGLNFISNRKHKRIITLTYYKEDAKKFPTKESAEKWLEKLNKTTYRNSLEMSEYQIFEIEGVFKVSAKDFDKKLYQRSLKVVNDLTEVTCDI
jgi:hypothetical protein